MASGSKKGKSVWPGKANPDHLIAHQEQVCFPILADVAGMRLDMFLKMRLSWRSRESVHRLLEQRDVRVDGEKRRASYRLKWGETVVVPCPPPSEDPEIMKTIPLHIIYEDDALVVLNKQPNVVVHPVGKERYGTLINALHLRYRRPDDPKHDVQPKLAHRLDRETSGVLVVCKSDESRRKVGMDFERGDVDKRYLALVEGVLAEDRGLIDAPIGKALNSDHGMKMGVRPDGVAARTEFETLERLGTMTLVGVRLLTGRTHQIRVHMQHIGHPVVCDKFYGVRKELRLSCVRPLRAGEDDRVLLDRQALHCHRLGMPHPFTRERLVLEAAMPDDMGAAVAAAREAMAVRGTAG
ncbi:MAG TPA: RluA family pseudouridine synthase [Candidatus Brocadiia bacterium]|nr:RluA family pseudouridine synthase [Candidatus Brocadiia bacterium]